MVQKIYPRLQPIAELNFTFISFSDQLNKKEDVIAKAVVRGLMVRALDSGVSVPGSSPGRRHCVVFLGKAFYSHGASLELRPGV